MNGVFFEVFQVKDLIRKVRLNQHVDVEIYVTQLVAIKCGRHIYVAVEAFQLAAWFTETKNVVPTIEPVEFGAYRTCDNSTEEVMFYISIKLGVEHQEREFIASYTRRPSSMLGAVVLHCANENCILRIAQLLPSALGPVSQELSLPFVRQWVIEHLLDHFERHCGDI